MTDLIAAPDIATVGGLGPTSLFPVTTAAGAQLYKATGAEMAAAFGGSGGGATPSWPSAPVAPDIANFTLLQGTAGSTTATNYSRGIGLEIQGAGNVDRNAILQVNTPGATWSMKALIQSNMLERFYNSFGVFAKDNATGKLHIFTLGSSGATDNYRLYIRPMTWTDLTTYNANADIAGNAFGGGPIWFRLDLGAANFDFYLSADGEQWNKVYSVGKNSWLAAIDRCGIWMGVNQQAAPQNQKESIMLMSFNLA